jgi:hypothetical protein
MPAGFTFDQAYIGIITGDLVLGSGTFLCELVTATPARTITFASSLTLVSGGSYTYGSRPLTAISRPATLQNGRAIITAAAPTFNSLWAAAATPIVGWVIVKQAGGSPAAASDRVVSYIPSATINESATIASVTTYSGFRMLTAADGTFSDVRIGAAITGSGIPAGATVAFISPDGGTLTISADATASATITVTTTTEVANAIALPTTVGTAVNRQFFIPANGFVGFIP